MKSLELTPAQRLRALRELDIFHRWESIDEKRLCRRCGQTITGRQIRILSDSNGRRPAHLECPTEGCLSVPLEWMMLDAPTEKRSTVLAKKPMTSRRRGSRRIFGFLRAPPTVV